jgi:hypothetical protein
MRRTALVSAACVAACGARTGLLASESSLDASRSFDAGTETTSSVDASSIDASLDAPIDVGPDVHPPERCRLVEKPSGEPIELLRFQVNNANAPQLVVLDPGASGAAPRDAVVAIEVFRSDGNDFPHPDIQIARASLGARWPGEVRLDREPQLFGVESHGWGEMVHAANADGVALAWHGDPGGQGRPIFRMLDAPSWTQSALVDVAPQGEAVIALAAGAGARNGGYAGDGYAVAWRTIVGTSNARPVLALLDRNGHPQEGPYSIAGAAPYPGRPSSIAWSGETYLTATAFSGDCAGDPQCVARSVVVGAVHPTGAEAGRIATAATFPAPMGGAASPHIASYAGITWVAWFEGNLDDMNGPRKVRVARVGARGERLADAMTVADGAHPLSRMGILAAETGFTIGWIEDGNTALSDDTPGRSRLVLVHGSSNDDPFDVLPAVPITHFASYGIEPSLAAIQSTRSIVAAYTARGRTQLMSPMWLVRFDCGPP